MIKLNRAGQAAGWLLVFILMTGYCQHYFAYNYFYAEQFYLFRFDSDYAWQTLSQPGGVVTYLAAFLTQFFFYTYAGAVYNDCLADVQILETHSSEYPCSVVLLSAVGCLAVDTDRFQLPLGRNTGFVDFFVDAGCLSGCPEEFVPLGNYRSMGNFRLLFRRSLRFVDSSRLWLICLQNKPHRSGGPYACYFLRELFLLPYIIRILCWNGVSC